MSNEELNQALRKGMGRAYLYVKEHGDTGIKDDILHFCLNNVSYDRQCEDGRAEWLLSIIDLTDDKDFYYSQIINALIAAEEYWDASQLFDLSALLAKRGIKEARTAMYEKFDLQEFSESYLGGMEIIELDGLEGFKHVAERIGKRLLCEDGYWDSDVVFDFACEQLGKDKVSEFLKKIAASDKYVQAYLKEMEDNQASKDSTPQKSYRERIREEYPLERILSDVEAVKGEYPGYYTQFGRCATDDEIEFVFKKLLSEERKEQLIRYLWIFRMREIPRLTDRLFQLAKVDDTEIQSVIMEVLENCQDSAVRNLAIDLVKTSDSEIALSAIALFKKNYEHGDHKFIEKALSEVSDQDVLHWSCMDIIRVFENHPLPELSECLLWIYENTPCTSCRNWVVKELIENDLMPESHLYECRFDCVEDTRNLVKQYFQKKSCGAAGSF